MADLPIVTLEQIETLLSKVANNYSALAFVFYDVFYNPEPMEVTFQMFDKAGVLQTYTIPNRAKDFTYLLHGEGNPENNVVGDMGSLYQDTLNGNVYIKQIPGGKTGWNLLLTQNVLDSYLLRGSGSPEGSTEATKGVLYVDDTNYALYMKTTTSGNTGWLLLTANTSVLANTNLSNLTAVGENKFLGSTRLGDCILAAPNGVASHSGNQVILPHGTVALAANGLTSTNALNNKQIEITIGISSTISWSTQEVGIALYDESNTLLRCCKAINFYNTDSTPTISTSSDIWYNPLNNTYSYVNANSWETAVMVRVAKFETDSSGDISSFYPEYPVKLATMADINNTLGDIESLLAEI